MPTLFKVRDSVATLGYTLMLLKERNQSPSFRFNGCGEPCVHSTKPTVLSSCSLSLAHRKFLCRVLQRLKAWTVYKNFKFIVTIVPQIGCQLHILGKCLFVDSIARVNLTTWVNRPLKWQTFETAIEVCWRYVNPWERLGMWSPSVMYCICYCKTCVEHCEKSRATIRSFGRNWTYALIREYVRFARA